MKRYLIALAFSFSLVACTPQQQGDALQCSLALYSANVRTAGELWSVAKEVPACRALATDILQMILNEVAARRGLK